MAGIGISALGRVPALYGQNAPSRRINVAVMGVNSRGDVLAQTFAQANGAEVVYVCDVDSLIRALSHFLAPLHLVAST